MEGLSISIQTEALLSNDHGLAVLLLHQDGTIRAANKAARAVLGKHAIAGARAFSVFDDESRFRLERALSATPWSVIELHTCPSDTAPIPVRFLVYPAPPSVLLVGNRSEAETRDFEVLLELNEDLAHAARELVQRATSLERAKRELERAAVLRDEFTATVSHDVRSPLHAIKLQAEVLERITGVPPSEELARIANAIVRNADRILRMVSQVLDAAHLDDGSVELKMERVSLNDIGRDVLDTYALVSAQAGVNLQFAETDSDVVVPGDQVRLFEVVSNLVDNAIRHSPKWGRVTVEVSRAGGNARVIVKDEGPGVPERLKDRLFDRFSQGRGGRVGTAGLGLYIVRRVVELHGGHVRYESAAPGAAFVVELPAIDS